MLHSVFDPGHINCVFVRDLNPAVIVVRERRTRKIVRGDDGRGRSCGKGGLRRGRVGLRGNELEVLEKGENEGCGRELAALMEAGHPGDSCTSRAKSGICQLSRVGINLSLLPPPPSDVPHLNLILIGALIACTVTCPNAFATAKSTLAMPFAQLIIGPPGSGKSTYCNGMQQFLSAIGRKCSVVNLDPANDRTSYPCALDIRDLVTLEEVMADEELGPNGGVLWALEELEHNGDWLDEGLKGLGEDYVLFDCPGQVELFTHHSSLRNLFFRIQKLGYRVRSSLQPF